MPYYIQLSRNAWNLGWNVIEMPEPDHKRLLYYMCNMLYFRHEITKNLGDLQCDNLDAETILNSLWQEINSLVERRFGYVDTSKLRCLVKDDIPYHKFCDRLLIVENKDLYDNFMKWIMNELLKRDKDAFEKCMWYSQLTMLELNHIYKSWYGESRH